MSKQVTGCLAILALSGRLLGQASVSPSDAEVKPVPETLAAILARAIAEELKEGDLPAVESRFDAQMAIQLPDSRFREAWAAFAAQAGRLTSCADVRTLVKGPYTLAFTNCAFEHGKAELRFTFAPDGRLAGFFFVPADARPPWSAPGYVTTSSFREREVNVVSGTMILPGTLTLPEGAGPFPGVVLVHGSGPQDRDESIGQVRPFQDLAQGLASRGIAALRYEKRTKAYQKELAGKPDLTIREEVIDDAVAAVRLLRGTPGVDPRRVIVVGHSLGGLLAPRIALDARLGGAVILAAPSRPMPVVVRDQAHALVARGTSEIQKLAAPGILREAKALEDVYAGRPGPPSGMILGAPIAYWLDLEAQAPLKDARSLAAPLLVLQGARDDQVTMADFSGWRRALAGRPLVTLKSYPTLDHLFVAGNGRSFAAESPKAGHVAAEVIEDVAAFVKKVPPSADGTP
jgi:uncharacterized protein